MSKLKQKRKLHKRPRVVTCLRCRRRVKRRKWVRHQKSLRCRNEGLRLRNLKRLATSATPVRCPGWALNAVQGAEIGIMVETAIDASTWKLSAERWIPLWAMEICLVASRGPSRTLDLTRVLRAAAASKILREALIPLIVIDDWDAIYQLVHDAKGLSCGEEEQEAEAHRVR